MIKTEDLFRSHIYGDYILWISYGIKLVVFETYIVLLVGHGGIWMSKANVGSAFIDYIFRSREHGIDFAIHNKYLYIKLLQEMVAGRSEFLC